MIKQKAKVYSSLKTYEGYEEKIADFLMGSETLFGIYKGGSSVIVFTNKRIIIISQKGFSEKNSDVTSIMYNKLSVFSGTLFSQSPSIEIFLYDIGKVTFSFSSNINVKELYKQISEAVAK